MASLRTQVFLKTLQNIPSQYSPLLTITRSSSIPPKRKNTRGTIKHRHLIDSNAESLAARGFLRSQKPYTPVPGVGDKIHAISDELFNGNQKTDSVLLPEQKFNLLNACFKEWKHGVPNSALHTILTVDDVVSFYETRVSTTTPYDEMKTMDLPPNLHIQHDYLRFHPDTDTAFRGVTAFPESSTVVTGLRYKNKYQGHTQKPPFWYDNWADYIKQK